jgi:hypothetical protein
MLDQDAVRQVLSVGDLDLWSVVLLWSHRLPVQLEDDAGGEFGVPVGADEDEDEGEEEDWESE